MLGSRAVRQPKACIVCLFHGLPKCAARISAISVVAFSAAQTPPPLTASLSALAPTLRPAQAFGGFPSPAELLRQRSLFQCWPPQIEFGFAPFLIILPQRFFCAFGACFSQE